MIGKPAQMSIAEVEAELDAGLDRAASGEFIIITRDGRPVACVGPIAIYADRGFGIPDEPEPD